jgi:two-component system, sensor histidine kinase PdtaS
MNLNEWLDNPTVNEWLWPAIAGLLTLILIIVVYKKIKQARRSRIELEQASAKIKTDNQNLAQAIRNRVIDHINLLARILRLNPVIPGNTPEDTTLESRNRTKCLSLVIEALPRDTKGQGIRMAEFIHQLSDLLVHAYGKEGIVHVTIDAHPIILDIDSAAHVALMLNELISNALQYAPVPGEKSKVTVIFKERTDKLFISVGDNGTGMKSPYIPKFSFGLQLVNTLVNQHKGEMIITSRPGTRVEIMLSEFQKAEREVFITPTTKVY